MVTIRTKALAVTAAAAMSVTVAACSGNSNSGSSSGSGGKGGTLTYYMYAAIEHLDPRPAGGSFFETPNYRAVHALFTDLLAEIVGAERAMWTGHALLSLTRIDLIGHMISVEGRSGEQLRRQIRDLAEQILGPGAKRAGAHPARGGTSRGAGAAARQDSRTNG